MSNKDLKPACPSPDSSREDGRSCSLGRSTELWKSSLTPDSLQLSLKMCLEAELSHCFGLRSHHPLPGSLGCYPQCYLVALSSLLSITAHCLLCEIRNSPHSFKFLIEDLLCAGTSSRHSCRCSPEMRGRCIWSFVSLFLLPFPTRPAPSCSPHTPAVDALPTWKTSSTPGPPPAPPSLCGRQAGSPLTSMDLPSLLVLSLRRGPHSPPTPSSPNTCHECLPPSTDTPDDHWPIFLPHSETLEDQTIVTLSRIGFSAPARLHSPHRGRQAPSLLGSGFRCVPFSLGWTSVSTRPGAGDRVGMIIS